LEVESFPIDVMMENYHLPGFPSTEVSEKKREKCWLYENIGAGMYSGLWYK